jgi:hypothetical protein
MTPIPASLTMPIVVARIASPPSFPPLFGFPSAGGRPAFQEPIMAPATDLEIGLDAYSIRAGTGAGIRVAAYARDVAAGCVEAG